MYTSYFVQNALKIGLILFNSKLSFIPINLSIGGCQLFGLLGLLPYMFALYHLVTNGGAGEVGGHQGGGGGGAGGAGGRAQVNSTSALEAVEMMGSSGLVSAYSPRSTSCSLP